MRQPVGAPISGFAALAEIASSEVGARECAAAPGRSAAVLRVARSGGVVAGRDGLVAGLAGTDDLTDEVIRR